MRRRWILMLVLLGAAVVAAGGWAWWHGRQASALGQAAYQQTAAILAYGPRPPGSAALQAVADHLQAELAQAGWVTSVQAFDQGTPNGKITFRNLRARLAAGAGDPWQRPVRGVLCAHLDSKYFKDEQFVGADDAASACAAMVEIARFLASQRPAQAAQLELAFFDGEEALGRQITMVDGLYGSRHYAGFWRHRDDRPKFAVLLDMIGHEPLSIRLPADTPADLKERVMAAAQAEDAERTFGVAAGPIIDDHVPLIAAGIPTVNLIGDFGSTHWWHTPADNSKVVSARSLDISIRVTLRLIAGLLEN